MQVESCSVFCLGKPFAREYACLDSGTPMNRNYLRKANCRLKGSAGF